MTLISQLPDKYRQLAEKREKEYRGENKSDQSLILAFDFTATPEGRLFWLALFVGEYPPIPESSLNEIMTIEEIRNMPGSYTMPGFTPGALYAFWDGDDPQEWTVARYSHSERTTPFDRHWTEGKKYFANVGECIFSVNGKKLTLLQVIEDFERTLKSREILAPEEGA